MMTATMDTAVIPEQHDLHPEGMELCAWLRTAIPISQDTEKKTIQFKPALAGFMIVIGGDWGPDPNGTTVSRV